jgi:hypothetical protein
MRLIFRVRPIRWMFRKNWYSLHRWKHPLNNNEGEQVKLIDIGSFTIGYAKANTGGR